MKLGLIARADNSGLGMQTWEFYRHMQPYKTMVVDISKYNNNKQYPSRYDSVNSHFIKGFPSAVDIDFFLQGLDVVFIAEAAYNPYLYTRAKELGIKTAVAYNYEFMDWLVNPNYPKPDMLIAPSKWHYKEVDAWCEANGVKHVYLHCPVDREALPFREIKKAHTFLHVAGRSAAHDRNGTNTVIEASKYIKNPVNIVIHFQGEQGLAHQATHSTDDYRRMLELHGDPNKVTIEQKEYVDYFDVYEQGDILLLPRRYGGNCLPVNEALSVGMPVIMPDISPNSEFLPNRWLVHAEKLHEFTPRTKVDIYEVNPQHLAKKIDKFADMNTAEMVTENIRANNVAESISWPNMLWKYQEVLEGLCAR